jgi:hypothetical protein
MSNPWTDIIDRIDNYVVNTTLSLKEIQSTYALDYCTVIGMIGIKDSLHALRLKYTNIDTVLRRINRLIMEDKCKRIVRHSRDAYDSVTK